MRKEHITIFVQQNLYNNSCTLLIPGEIWSKGSNLTSTSRQVFATVAEVKNIAEEKPRQNVFSYSYLGILFVAAKNAETQGLLAYLIFALCHQHFEILVHYPNNIPSQDYNL